MVRTRAYGTLGKAGAKDLIRGPMSVRFWEERPWRDQWDAADVTVLGPHGCSRLPCQSRTWGLCCDVFCRHRRMDASCAVNTNIPLLTGSRCQHSHFPIRLALLLPFFLFCLSPSTHQRLSFLLSPSISLLISVDRFFRALHLFFFRSFHPPFFVPESVPSGTCEVRHWAA